jgi:zinc-ribbon domain
VKSPPETCPNCGADVPAKAQACPQCGADEKTGWSETAYVAGLNLPDESFNYDEFVEQEFGKKKVRPEGIRWHWWLVAAILLLLFVGGLMRFR